MVGGKKKYTSIDGNPPISTQPGLRRQGRLCQAGGDREARVQGSSVRRGGFDELFGFNHRKTIGKP